MKRKDKIGILSLGCPRNLVDSESILSNLRLKGHIVTDIANADTAIVNTCGFIEEAKRESIEAILGLIDLKKKGKLKRVIVYGCLAQRYRQELQKELPEVDAFVGKIGLDRAADRFALTPRHYAYLKICESCVNNCSYCIIPKIKGRFESLDSESVVNKARALDRQKISEINIIGQDITGYGIDIYGGFELARLIKRISGAVKNIGWIRLLYLYPSRIGDDLLDLIANDRKLCKYIDLPVQHISDRILKSMNRRTAKKDIIALINKIRKKIPQVALRTSIIVGYPSETDKEFKELLRFVEDARFDKLGAFIYSREEGTKAYNLKGQVPRAVKNERFNQVMAKQQGISREINSKFLGMSMDVLVEEKDKGGYLGRTQYDAPEVDGSVYIKSNKALNPGDFVKVKITDTLEYDLAGEAL